MTYNCFDNGQKSPVLVDAEVGRAILSLSVGVYPQEVLSVFPSEGVHLSWTFKRNQHCGRAVGVKSNTIHP
jgi:hypothetical protein